MKKTLLHVLLSASFLFIGCSEEANPYKEFEQERLAQLASENYEAIRQLAQPTNCSEAAEWKIAEIQSVCGTSYIAYHKSTDERKLRELIKDHNLVIEIYRPYVAPFIYCLAYREPTGVSCEDGKAIVQYPEYQEPSN
jgi:hypothetical protein